MNEMAKENHQATWVKLQTRILEFLCFLLAVRMTCGDAGLPLEIHECFPLVSWSLINIWLYPQPAQYIIAPSNAYKQTLYYFYMQLCFLD